MSEPRPRALRSGAAFVWSILSLLLFLPIGVLAWPFDRQQWVYGKLSVVWARGILALAGIELVVRGLEHVSPEERYMVISNHQSALDPVVLVAALQPRIPIRFLAKRSLFRIPVLGWGMGMYDHLAIDRENVRASLAELRRAQTEIETRFSTVFFPEGTRTSTGELQAFRGGAFRIALRARAPILPVTVTGSFAAFPRATLRAHTPATVTVHIHTPLEVPPTDERPLRETVARCRAQIASALPTELRGDSG